MINKKEVLDLAMTVIKTQTYNPYEAIIEGLQMWLVKNKMMLISEQEYACFMEQQKYVTDGEDSGEALEPNPASNVD